MMSFRQGRFRIRRHIAAVARDRRGVTLIEYTMIAALVAVALTVSLTSLKGAISTTIGSVVSVLDKSAAR